MIREHAYSKYNCDGTDTYTPSLEMMITNVK